MTRIRALITLTVAMGAILIGGTSLLGVLIFQRLSTQAAPLPPLSLDEPAGTRIAGITAVGERLALRLEGGGSDRVVIVDPAHGRIITHIRLLH
jgi:hypothetical protein